MTMVGGVVMDQVVTVKSTWLVEDLVGSLATMLREWDPC
eukprot:SAG31_NODE_19126_length_611_cov_1.242188_2_plen_38_part_01